jgi:thioredoxin reductase
MQVTDAQDLATYDVVVVGGGAAGLGGALMLGRSRRSVLVVDAGEPRNAPASGVHGFLTRDGIDPAALLRVGREEVVGYGARVIDGRVASAERVEGGFTVTLEDGRRAGARRLLVTTGLVDELPDVPGVRERWGRDVLHCPYCHGWEVRDLPIGVLASGPVAVHQALLFRQLTEDLTLFLHTGPDPTGEELEKLAARGIAVVEGEVAALEVHEDRLTGVRLQNGEVIPRGAVAVGPRFVACAGMLAGLGLETTTHPSGMGEHVEAGAMGLTSVPGVWVAGNVTDPTAQVLASTNAGAMAGAAINADLMSEATREAVAAYRDRLSSTAGARRS